MNVLIASAESVPFAKVGGLADVVPNIAKSVLQLGHEVKVVLPLYASIDRSRLKPYLQPMIVNMGYGVEFARLWACKYDEVEYFFIEFERYFGRNGVYGENGNGYSDNWERFAFFSRAVIDMCFFLNWIPEVIHANDWHTGLIPVFLREQQVGSLQRTASVFTIHNMGYHGYGPYDLLRFVGLPTHLFNPFALEACGGVNMMKGALQYADKITTVSPSYASEIQTLAGGWGLDDVLRYRSADLIGICNAVDTNIWSPKSDRLIAKNFSYHSLHNKDACKLDLQKKFGLEVDKSVFTIGVVARFVEQKGLDFVCDLLPEWENHLHVQFVILGSGDSTLEYRFTDIMHRYSGRISVKIGYDETLVHVIEAGADCFLMPSRYEPCGMNQMYSMLYGTLPIVHAVGGLRDTVENYNERSRTGTGFVFEDFTHGALYNTVCWACSTYYDRKDDFRAMQKQAMKKDFSLAQFGRKYADVYRFACERKV
ncbi:MAG: glycogen synthase GlgA [Opitutales bacterium]|nr:glycogen synthase GlgA [Opitutales bacterium]